MAFSTVVSYVAGLGLLRWDNPRIRKFFLTAPITIDLFLLGFFKYSNFLVDTLKHVSALFEMPVHLFTLDVVLPVGISSYTFHCRL